MSQEHKPDCGIHISCAVYHADGICNHPQYGKCTCKTASQEHTVEETRKITDHFRDKYGSITEEDYQHVRACITSLHHSHKEELEQVRRDGYEEGVKSMEQTVYEASSKVH